MASLYTYVIKNFIKVKNINIIPECCLIPLSNQSLPLSPTITTVPCFSQQRLVLPVSDRIEKSHKYMFLCGGLLTVDSIMAPQNAHLVNPKICVHVMLHSKMTGVIEVIHGIMVAN